MISSYLQGGLGNQMFQIAAAYSLSRQIGVECMFDFNNCYTPNQGHSSKKYVSDIFKNIKNFNLNEHKLITFHQKKFAYGELPKIDNLILLGDFQTEKYFIDYIEEVKNLFYFDENKKLEIRSKLMNISNNEKITAVHVRRGDYLTKPNFHPTCDIDYYKKAFELIDGNKFIFVSDDIKWCRDNFNGDNFYYSDFTNEIDDLYLIMMCDNQIIANSSFSWWGSYLCPFNNKIIAPSKWFGPQGPQDTQDIYIKNWIKL
jgi:uncharacterized ubiquitin-like protein YukD